MRDIFDLTALELGAAIRKGEVSPTQAAQAALKRMEETKENGRSKSRWRRGRLQVPWPGCLWR